MGTISINTVMTDVKTALWEMGWSEERYRRKAGLEGLCDLSHGEDIKDSMPDVILSRLSSEPWPWYDRASSRTEARMERTHIIIGAWFSEAPVDRA